jgi:hypothetical protein
MGSVSPAASTDDARSFVVRPMAAEDAPQLLALMKALALFESYTGSSQ